MGSGLNNMHIIFIVNDMEMLETLCKHIQRMGFTISDATNPDDIFQEFNVTSFPIKRMSSAKTKKDLHIKLFNILSSISSGAKSVLLALQDLSLMKICRNYQHKSIESHPTLSEIEKEHIIATLEKCSWQRKISAKLLGINRTTLYRKMKMYGITSGKKSPG
ncbi:helix-turn-helix domain-containing protein [Candidatus Latescibacterota bacterium]